MTVVRLASGSGSVFGQARSIVLPLVAGGVLVALVGTLFEPAFPIGAPATVAISSGGKPLDQIGAVTSAASKVASSETDLGPADVTVSMRGADTAARPTDDGQRLVQRGKNYLAEGDVAAARPLLQRAADAGSADAVFALASTYDPNVLVALGTRGLVGEPEQAKALYARALAAGLQAAAPRITALGG